MLQAGGVLDNPIAFLLYYMPFLIFMLYGQRIQIWIMLNQARGSMNKLKSFKEKARLECSEYIKSNFKPAVDPVKRIDQIIDYFTIMPVSVDPAGVMNKIEHVVTLQDERLKEEIRDLAGSENDLKLSVAGNIVEAATALNFIYKIVRHLYLMGRRTNSTFVLVQLQMMMPTIMQEAEALIKAVDAFKLSQPIGDGVGAMVAAHFMVGKEKKVIAKDTLLSQGVYNNRSLYVIKAEGPGGNVGQPGAALERLVKDMGVEINTIIMVDAALKLEGETTGDIAEGIGAAIGGIGVDRYKIEEVASKHNIPVYAVVVKQSIVDAISTMKKEIADAAEKAVRIVQKIVEERTKEGESIVLVGVGNTIGVGQ